MRPGILAVLQFAWSMSLAGLRVGAVAVTHASSHLEDDEVFMDLGQLNFFSSISSFSTSTGRR